MLEGRQPVRAGHKQPQGESRNEPLSNVARATAPAWAYLAPMQRPGAAVPPDAPTVDDGAMTGERSMLGEAPIAGGGMLPAPIAERFSAAYGRDVSNVRVHAESSMASDIGARAFTIGRDIAFAPGQYKPGTTDGDRLIGHELAHVVQQAGGAGTLQASGLDSENAYEREADRAAEAAISGTQVSGLSAVRGARLQCDKLPKAETDAAKVEPGTDVAKAEALMTTAATAALTQVAAGGDLGAALEQEVTSALANSDVSSYDVDIKALIPDVVNVRADVGGKSYGYVDAMALLTAYLGLPPTVAPPGQGSFAVEAFITASAQDIAPHLASAVDRAHGQGTFKLAMSFNLSERVASWADKELVLKLELEGTLSGLMGLRTAFQRAGDASERAQVGNKIGALARRALLLDQAIKKLWDAQPGGDSADASPLEQSLIKSADEIAQIREQATIEASTQAQLGDSPKLLRPAQASLSETERVTSEPEELEQTVSPEEAFPRSSDAAVTDFTQKLAQRTNEQAAELEVLRAKVLPALLVPKTPKEDRKAKVHPDRGDPKNQKESPGPSLVDFEAVYRRWFAFFSVTARDADPEYESRRKLVEGVWAAAGMADAQGGMARYMLMRQLGHYIGGVIDGPDTDFSEAMRKHDLQPKDDVDGTAGRPRYKFGQTYAGASDPYNEGDSRDEVLRREAKRTQRLLRAASSKNPTLRGMVPPFEPGAITQAGPDAPLKNARAKESWTYLVTRVYEGPQGPIEVVEAKLMPPEVARYLLAREQHLQTLETAHRPGLGDTPLSLRGKLEKHGRGTAAARYLDGAPDSVRNRDVSAAQEQIASRAAAAGAVTEPKPLDPPAPASERVVAELLTDLEAYLDAFFAAAPTSIRLAAVLTIAISEFGADAKLKQHLTPEALGKALAIAASIEAVTTVISRFGGRLGAAVSQGIHSGMKLVGLRADTPSATMATIGSFFALAGEVTSFRAARVYAFFGALVADSVGQLLQMVAAGAVVGAAKGGIMAGIGKIKSRGKPPTTVREMYDAVEPLLADPSARKDMAARLHAEIEAMRAEKPGEQNPELEQLEAMEELVSGKRKAKKDDPALDRPLLRENPEEPTGKAARFANPNAVSKFRGEALPGEARPAITPEQFQAELGNTLPNAVDLSGANAVAVVENSGVTLQLSGTKTTSVTVRIVLADKPMPDVAQYYLAEGGTEATVRVSPGARLQDVERALSHELAEIQAKIDGRDAQSDALDWANGGGPTDKLSGHDYGRLAEMRVLFDQLGREPQTTEHTKTPGYRQDTLKEIDSLLVELGLARASPHTTARIRAVVKPPEFAERVIGEINELNQFDWIVHRSQENESVGALPPASQAHIAQALKIAPELLKKPRSTAEIESVLHEARIELTPQEVDTIRGVINATIKNPVTSSRAGTDAFLDLVWDKRVRIRTDKIWVYDLYKDPTDGELPLPNPLRGDEMAYLSDIAKIAKARPPDAVSVIQKVTNPEPGDQISGKIDPANQSDLGGRFYMYYREGAIEFARDQVGGLVRDQHGIATITKLPKAKYRVYMNVAADNATEVMSRVVREIVDDPKTFPGISGAKLTGPGVDGIQARSDAIVIYCESPDAMPKVLDWARARQSQSPDAFKKTTPPMTEQVVPGVSVGAEPTAKHEGESFGWVRSLQIMQALRETDRTDNKGIFKKRAYELLGEADVDVMRPHQNKAPLPKEP